MIKHIQNIFLVCLLVISTAGANGQSPASTTNQQQTAQPETGKVPSGITPARAKALAGAALGLIGLVAGIVALRRSKKAPYAGGRKGAILALVLGLVCTGLSVFHLATTKGGFGTGGGRAGAIVALVLGLTAMLMGWVAMRRSNTSNPVNDN